MRATTLVETCRRSKTIVMERRQDGDENVRYLANAKVATQLLAAFGVVLSMLTGIGLLGLSGVYVENDHVESLRQNLIPGIRASQQMRAALKEAVFEEFREVTSQTPDPAVTKAIDDQIDVALREYHAAANEYEKIPHRGSEQAAYARIKLLMPKYLELDSKVRALAKGGQTFEAIDRLTSEGTNLREGIEKALRTITDVNLQAASDEGNVANATYFRARNWIAALIAAAVAIGVLVTMVIMRGLAHKLGGEPGEAAELAAKIASGDLLVRVPVRTGDTSSLMHSIAIMRERLAHIVVGIKSSSDSIAVAASQIAQGNADLSQRTEEQAAALERTASSMEQLTGTVKLNAENAHQATSLAQTAADVAGRGGEVVGRVVDTMRGISTSSTKMSEIIAVIESIAFQTNILALNAAVEAARAGEGGRGFAVVASEVRNLAQRSAVAAREIKELIGESNGRVEHGSKLVEEAGSTIGEVVSSVQRVASIMLEISSASNEQSTGIEHVNRSITQIDGMTQQNASLVEQASAAAHAMDQQAGSLREAVAAFRVEIALH